MSYEVLGSETVGDELVKLVRKGRRFRVLAAPSRKVHAATNSQRWVFEDREVAWRAFEFALAQERYWKTTSGDGRAALRDELAHAARAFREAAMRHWDPPELAGLAGVLDDG